MWWSVCIYGRIKSWFFEPLDQSYYPKLLTYIFAAGGTFCIFSYTIKVFTKGKVANILTIISYVQLVGFVLATFYIDNFILVIGNYAPILFFFFIMNVINFKKGKKEKYLTFFCIVMNLGTCVQLTKINISELIHSSTLFHVIILFGYIIMYYGIQQKRS